MYASRNIAGMGSDRLQVVSHWPHRLHRVPRIDATAAAMAARPAAGTAGAACPARAFSSASPAEVLPGTTAQTPGSSRISRSTSAAAMGGAPSANQSCGGSAFPRHSSPPANGFMISRLTPRSAASGKIRSR